MLFDIRLHPVFTIFFFLFWLDYNLIRSFRNELNLRMWIFINQNEWYWFDCWFFFFFYFSLRKNAIFFFICLKSTSFTDKASIKTDGRYETTRRNERIWQINTCTTHYTDTDKSATFHIGRAVLIVLWQCFVPKRKQLFNQSPYGCGCVHAYVLVYRFVISICWWMNTYRCELVCYAIVCVHMSLSFHLRLNDWVRCL